MAVFMINGCKFAGCGLIFSTLRDLIHHIEDTHVVADADESKMDLCEMQPHCVAVSNVLRVFGHVPGGRKMEAATPIGRNKYFGSTAGGRSHSPAPSLSSLGTTPNGSEMEEDDASVSGESSIDSPWSHFANAAAAAAAGDPNLLKMMSSDSTNSSITSSMSLGSSGSISPPSNLNTNNNANSNPMNGSTGKMLLTDDDKPYVCGVNGCTRRYRNINGLKYHKRNTHRPPTGPNGEPLPPRIYTCKSCGKIYKTPHGLKSHDNKYHKGLVPVKQQQQQQAAAAAAAAANGSQFSPPPTTPIKTAKQIKTEPTTPVTMNTGLSAASMTTMNGMAKVTYQSPIAPVNNNNNNTTATPIMITNKKTVAPPQQPMQMQIDNTTVVSITANNGNNNGGGFVPTSVSAPTLQQHLLSPIK